ncbi:hypothetical protein [Flavobacterium sp. I3-2]|uniref:hypothetical protein n=1 Tax=Flavobacterium sp. I3-2 TaxID=2748319 RepID=UPI0015B0F656|nr:hypothetical protein [Flavobacterium sp. I3-2]
MMKLIVYDANKTNLLTETSFGGNPVKLVNTSFEWPICKYCQKEMQFQGKIKTDLGYELIFQCQSNPGMCEDWDANAGGNKAIIIDDSAVEFVFPNNSDVALRTTEYGVNIVEQDCASYDVAYDNWDGGPRTLLGHLFGEPMWMQADETPNCDCCDKPMRFVAQLEEGPVYETSMNFAGGTGFLFDCKEGKTAKFLWQ